MFRSLGLLALAAIACISMVAPAAASMPLDPGIRIAAASDERYPAAAFSVVDQVAILAEAPAVSGASVRLPSQHTVRVPEVPLVRPADQTFIDLRMRC
ncbi:hypothetical protein QN224_13160 [Sinorhizobium sp. 8-89]|uniref:hypothetical protein n=1 Tax=Sinorhizobium sp. 7-81 TaxID=3049087 RepID=UPI0024C4317C|nr:hypothetical protein [Sinorhizobium sp. 7-81]MDK1386358.1 hypothetical protein [Sinorhizobium sp. 7-81]